MKMLFYITLLWLTGLNAYSQDFSAYKENYFLYQNTELPYRILMPEEGDSQQYPLLIFLHGAFEKGVDNKAQLAIGGSFFLRDSVRKHYPAYVLFPQCPADDSWAYFENQVDYTTGFAKDWNFPFRKTPTMITQVLIKLIDSICASGKIDLSRVYIAGLSQGGMGVQDLIARYPDLFAAGIAMCGAGDPSTSKLFLDKVALWIFHGDKDPVVPPDFSKQFYRKLRKSKKDTRFSLYANVQHNCWNNAFAEPELLSWLFSQKK